MELRYIYDPVLRQKARPVEVFDAALKKRAEAMVPVMKAHSGLGLAAPQVGNDERLIVYGYEPTGPDDELPRIPFMYLANPRVAKFSQEKDTMPEGCLSLPGLELPVERSSGVVVEANDLDGKPVTIKAKGIVARILQHEIDHLDGVLFTDRAKNLGKLTDYSYARIVFFGSDSFSLPVFTALVDAGLHVLAAVVETDKPAGRGQKLQSPIMKQAAIKRGVAVFQPETKSEITALLEQLEPDLVVLASYGKILPAEALAVPLYGSLNVHPSLLPKYRGATPIQSAILSGEEETGVTIMTMAAAVDAGRIVLQETAPITAHDTSVTLREKLAKRGAALLLRALPPYLAGQANLEAQDEAKVTTTTKLSKEMAQIDWTQPPHLVDRQIRALQPWPGAFTYLEGKRLKILASQMKGDRVELLNVQLEGKTPTAWPDFVRGYQSALKKTDWYAKIA